MRHARWLALGAALAATGCAELGDDVDGFSSEEWKRIREIEPLATPMPRNPFNRRDTDRAVARLGQMLFFEVDLAEALTADGPTGKAGETGKVGCVTCHDPKRQFIDSRPFPTSHGRTGFTRRNTPTMVNLGWYEWIGWAGRHDSLMMHGAGVWGTSASVLSYAHYLYRKYRQEYDAAFPDTPLDPALDPAAPDAARFPPTGNPKASPSAPDGPWEKMAPEDQRIVLQIQANLGRVFDAYPRMLVSRNSPFERYVRGDHGALGPAARRGLRLFIGKAACNDCHTGPLLSDGKFHNIGVPDPPGAQPDLGRFGDMSTMLTSPFSGAGPFSDDREAGRRKHATVQPNDESMKGAFRTPMLLNVAETGPYFHTGLFGTLEDVVRFYNRGGGEPGTYAGTKDPKLVPLGLTEAEITDLVEFLKSLTGAPPDEEWTRDIAKH